MTGHASYMAPYWSKWCFVGRWWEWISMVSIPIEREIFHGPFRDGWLVAQHLLGIGLWHQGTNRAVYNFIIKFMNTLLFTDVMVYHLSPCKFIHSLRPRAYRQRRPPNSCEIRILYYSRWCRLCINDEWRPSSRLLSNSEAKQTWHTTAMTIYGIQGNNWSWRRHQTQLARNSTVAIESD